MQDAGLPKPKARPEGNSDTNYGADDDPDSDESSPTVQTSDAFCSELSF